MTVSIICTIHVVNIIRTIKSKRIIWAGHAEPMGKMRNTYKILVGYLVEKGQFGTHRHRWEENILKLILGKYD
jgi:hypothetical protein